MEPAILPEDKRKRKFLPQFFVIIALVFTAGVFSGCQSETSNDLPDIVPPKPQTVGDSLTGDIEGDDVAEEAVEGEIEQEENLEDNTPEGSSEEDSPPEESASDNSIIITTPSQGETFREEPIELAGTVSSGATKVVAKAVMGDVEDVYTLRDFKKGDEEFSYRVKQDWDSLAPGTNFYTFTAHFEDGSTAEATVSIEFLVEE